MGRPGFRDCVVLAASGIPWAEVRSWSQGRRLAALIAIGESRGGTMNWRSGQMEWPGGKQ